MNINRNNYESFFLLYVDNELSAAERKTVELFVQENTDLQEELLMLQQTIIIAEETSFGDTSVLLKEEGISALQENLLLLADNELSADQKASLLKTIAADKAVAADWASLQSAKLQPETIVFEDKASLYRKAPAKVVGFNWKRLAAAAVFIGLLGWGGWKLFFTTDMVKSNGNTELANGTKKNNGNQDVIREEKKSSAVENNDAHVADNTTSQPEQVAVTSTKDHTAPKQAAEKNNLPVNRDNTNDVPSKNENIATVVPKKETNNLPEPLYRNINNEPRNKDIIAAVPYTDVNEANNPKNNGIALASNGISDKLKTTDPSANPIAKTAVLKQNEDGSFIDTDNNKKRSKLGGFLRKVSRVITRTTNAPEGDGKSVKIAGFDIAIN